MPPGGNGGEKSVIAKLPADTFDEDELDYPEIMMPVKRPLLAAVDVTTLKMSLGTIAERLRTEDLQITKHGKPQAVIISVDRYHQLAQLETLDSSSLEALKKEFDDKLARMQQGEAMNHLMHADEDDIIRFLKRHYDQNRSPPTAK